MYRGKPVVLICGDGGSGKDEVAKLISFHWKLPYLHSTSYVAAKVMWSQVKDGLFFPPIRHKKVSLCPYPELEAYSLDPSNFQSLEDFYNARVKHRKFWAAWIDAYNQRGHGVALYVEAVMDGNHILTGIRKLHELHNFIRTQIPDLSIWIDRPGVPRDPTQEFGPECCDFVLRNDSDLAALTLRVKALARVMEIMCHEIQ